MAGVGAIVNLFVEGNQGAEVFVALAGGLLYFIAPFSIARHIAMRPVGRSGDDAGRDRGVPLYRHRVRAHLPGDWARSRRRRSSRVTGDGTISDDLFFSFVTLTTTGYGNLVPSQNPGQSLAVMEALVGQLFLVTAVAKIVGAWRPRGWDTRREDSAERTGRPVAAT